MMGMSEDENSLNDKQTNRVLFKTEVPKSIGYNENVKFNLLFHSITDSAHPDDKLALPRFTVP